MARQRASFGDSRFGASGRTKVYGPSEKELKNKKSYNVELKNESVRDFAHTNKTGMEDLKKRYKGLL